MVEAIGTELIPGFFDGEKVVDRVACQGPAYSTYDIYPSFMEYLYVLMKKGSDERSEHHVVILSLT